MAERLYQASDKMLNRSAYVDYLNRCADDWMRLANGSYYGITRKQIDQSAVEQAERVRETARMLERIN